MATIVPKPPQLSARFPSTLIPISNIRLLPIKPSDLPLRRHATDDESNDTAAAAAAVTKEPEAPTAADPSFDKRLAQVRVKYRSGTGKKAEQRRAKKSSSGSSGGGGKKKALLPPVPLREPTTSDGIPVELGFTRYSERLNGRLAALGLAALLLVELGSGKSLINYHTPAIVFIQVYTVAAAAALFVKYEKERNSIWPQK